MLLELPEQLDSPLLRRSQRVGRRRVLGKALGYAYAGTYRPRAAYRDTVENSIYIREDAVGQGVGRALLPALVAECEARDLRQMIAAKQISPEAALGIVPKVCEALQFAHDEGIVVLDPEGAGIVQRVDLGTLSGIRPTRMVESPILKTPAGGGGRMVWGEELRKFNPATDNLVYTFQRRIPDTCN